MIEREARCLARSCVDQCALWYAIADDPCHAIDGLSCIVDVTVTGPGADSAPGRHVARLTRGGDVVVVGIEGRRMQQCIDALPRDPHALARSCSQPIQLA